MMDDLHMQQYLFDLQGYVVIENALDTDDLAELNRLVDQQNLAPPDRSPRFGSAPAGAGFLEWGAPFCRLLDHPSIMPTLRFRLGDCFRLDRIYGMYMREGTPGGGFHADYGAMSPTEGVEHGEYYAFKDNQIYNGFMVVAWNLTDAGPDYGGFCCIPGSHKSHYRMPKQVEEERENASCVVIPEAPAGSVILFTESLTHATVAWKGAHERRTLLYKYCVSHLAWTSKRVNPPESTELTPRQQILFRDPGDPHRFFPSLFKEEVD